jgi:uncharacterized beta-barrel protein YwiB (DUF1934 family)
MFIVYNQKIKLSVTWKVKNCNLMDSGIIRMRRTYYRDHMTMTSEDVSDSNSKIIKELEFVVPEHQKVSTKNTE